MSSRYALSVCYADTMHVALDSQANRRNNERKLTLHESDDVRMHRGCVGLLSELGITRGRSACFTWIVALTYGRLRVTLPGPSGTVDRMLSRPVEVAIWAAPSFGISLSVTVSRRLAYTFSPVLSASCHLVLVPTGPSKDLSTKSSLLGRAR